MHDEAYHWAMRRMPECSDPDHSNGSEAADVFLRQSQRRAKTKRTKRATTQKTKVMTTKTTTVTRSEHGKQITFSKLVDKLQQHYGTPPPPPSADPLELIIWENVAYLASDQRRAVAFTALKETLERDRSRFLLLSTLLWRRSAKLAYCRTSAQKSSSRSQRSRTRGSTATCVRHSRSRYHKQKRL